MAVKLKKPSLDAQVKDYFVRRNENGAEGLKLLVTCIERTAKYRDWDALSRFITASASSSSRSKVVKIVRAAFGEALTYKSSPKHDTGGTIVMGWEGEFPLAGRNAWGIVKDAARNGRSWDDRDFLKELPGPMPKAKTVDAAAQEKAAKHLAKYLLEREAEGFVTGEIMQQVMANIKAAHATKPAETTKKVVNGAEVIEIN